MAEPTNCCECPLSWHDTTGVWSSTLRDQCHWSSHLPVSLISRGRKLPAALDGVITPPQWCPLKEAPDA